MEEKQNVEQAVILMGGIGSRFMPATKFVAKELFPVVDKPVLLFHLQELFKSGIKRVCIVCSEQKKYIKDFLKRDAKLEKQLANINRLNLLDETNQILDGMKIDVVVQGKLNGSGGAIYTAKKWTKGKPFALILGDDLCEEIGKNGPAIGQLIKAFEKTGKTVVGAQPFPMEVISRYSSIVKNKKLFANCHEMDEIIEKPALGTAPSNLVGLARYVLTDEIFEEIPKCPRFENGEIRFTDALNNLAKKGRCVCYEFKAKYYDCGNKLEFIKCIVDTGLKDKKIAPALKEYLSKL